MEIGRAFQSLESYNDNMRKGLEDKLFFLQHLPDNEKYLFVDFGCADGSLMDALYRILGSENKYIGYDISDQMIDLARVKMNESPDCVQFTSDWNTVAYETFGSSYKKVLILSSVIHEVYSYGKESDIEYFWDKVVDRDWDYICVRDMMVPATYQSSTKLMWLKTSFSHYEKELTGFEKVWGKIDNDKGFIHFLLKYRWRINWNRELHENYLPIDIDTFLKKMCEKFNLDYFKRFKVPFLEQCWEKELFLKIDECTHIKAIFQKP